MARGKSAASPSPPSSSSSAPPSSAAAAAATPGEEVSGAARRSPVLQLLLLAVVAVAAYVAHSMLSSSSSPPPRPTFPAPSSPYARSQNPEQPAGQEWPVAGHVLQMWDPVAVNHTRMVKLDDSERLYEMRTLAMDPPIFVIEDFLSPAECDKIIEQAGQVGLFKSDHTYLDGSNLDERHKDTRGLSAEEANKLFRYSDQTWLAPSNDAMLVALLKRARVLAMLPDDASTESLQVVRYGSEGHYESHYDSEDEDKGPCCIDPIARSFATGVNALSRPLAERCRLCRFMTILYYLVDTEEGGGTIFPLADLTEEQFAAWRRSPFYRQTQNCKPGLVVPVKRGKAVLWYNHKWDRGYLGGINPRALHGGCNVKKGQKWIANHWMSYLPHPEKPYKPAVSHT